MAILDLVDKNDPILKQSLEKFDFRNPPVNPHELADNLYETMLHNRGIGLSANQCGLPYRVFVISSNPRIICFNPVIVDTSDDKVTLIEGCLSYPEYYVKVARPSGVRVRYADADGQIHTRVLHGLPARVFQHEYDHMEGINFKQRANKYHLEQAKKMTARKLARQVADFQLWVYNEYGELPNMQEVINM